MDGPRQQPHDQPPPLFGTSHAAGQQAAQKAGAWRVRILNHLRETGGSTLFEVAAHFGVPDHTISGRFTNLKDDLLIERSGVTRPHPVSGCAADVWRIRGAINKPQPDLAAALGYPLAINIGGEAYDRQELGPRESYAGFPYSRRADTGGMRLAVRVELIECPQCGKPLKFVPENGVKKFRCGTPSCGSTWHCEIVSEAGQPAVLALVRKTF